MQTFNSSEQVLDYLQQRFGSANFRSWQTLRRQFYSFVPYLAAGSNIYNFFGTAVGGLNRQYTNIPKANSIGQNHFLVKSIRTAWTIPDVADGSYVSTDATTLYSDLVHGPFQAGVLEFTINARLFAQIPKPFMYAPNAQGEPTLHAAGLRALTLAEGTPNTLTSASLSLPHARQSTRKGGIYLMDPNVLIEAEQNFDVSIRFDSGALGLIATSINNDSTNPLRIGVILDGILFRPVQ